MQCSTLSSRCWDSPSVSPWARSAFWPGRDLLSALIRFVVDRILKVLQFRLLVIPLYLVTAITTGLIGSVTVYPVQFLLWIPNGASGGVLRVGTMAHAMQAVDDSSASAAGAMIGAGYDMGRIVGPALGGLAAAAFGLPTMFIVMPAFFIALILPITLRTRAR